MPGTWEVLSICDQSFNTPSLLWGLMPETLGSGLSRLEATHGFLEIGLCQSIPEHWPLYLATQISRLRPLRCPEWVGILEVGVPTPRPNLGLIL